MKINHKEALMDLDIRPDGDKSEKRDMKTLSGGEKSFSQVALVLSLWSEIDAPFRILDEFDVFMDSHNRTVALK